MFEYFTVQQNYLISSFWWFTDVATPHIVVQYLNYLEGARLFKYQFEATVPLAMIFVKKQYAFA